MNFWYHTPPPLHSKTQNIQQLLPPHPHPPPKKINTDRLHILSFKLKCVCWLMFKMHLKFIYRLTDQTNTLQHQHVIWAAKSPFIHLPIILPTYSYSSLIVFLNNHTPVSFSSWIFERSLSPTCWSLLLFHLHLNDPQSMLRTVFYALGQ